MTLLQDVAHERIMRHTDDTDNYPELVVHFGSAPHSAEVFIITADSLSLSLISEL